LIGSNTDGPGFIESIKKDGNFEPKGKNALVLGAGGAGRAVAICLKVNGINNLSIFDTDTKKAEALALSIGAKFIRNKEEIQMEVTASDLLVNCTPIGMSPLVDRMPIPENVSFQKGLVVYDLVYNPFKTKLMKKAEAEGAIAVSGLGMLINQGALAFEIFTGQKAPYEVMKKAAYSALGL
jgi:shikimate dehydrogenase